MYVYVPGAMMAGEADKLSDRMICQQRGTSSTYGTHPVDHQSEQRGKHPPPTEKEKKVKEKEK